MTRKLHTTAYGEWDEQREHAADEYAQAQRRAFLDGFETAAKESEQFNLLREWLEEQRDDAKNRYEEYDEMDDFVRYHTYRDVLVKLSEMGCTPDDD